MALLNDNGTMSKGFEILLRQILKMMNFDPELIIGQINAIHGGLVRHVAQQDILIAQNAEIIQRLERIENDKRDMAAGSLNGRCLDAG